MNWLKEIFLRWVFNEWAAKTDANINQALKKIAEDNWKKADDNRKELSLFMQDHRAYMRRAERDSDDTERRHKELIEAISQLRRPQT